MVEWSREYYIDPATTGLNTVRVIREEDDPDQLDANEGEDLEGRGGTRSVRGASFSSRLGVSEGEPPAPVRGDTHN